MWSIFKSPSQSAPTGVSEAQKDDLNTSPQSPTGVSEVQKDDLNTPSQSPTGVSEVQKDGTPSQSPPGTSEVQKDELSAPSQSPTGLSEVQNDEHHDIATPSQSPTSPSQTEVQKDDLNAPSQSPTGVSEVPKDDLSTPSPSLELNDEPSDFTFTSASTQKVELNSLVESTCSTLQFLEPWSSASSKHRDLVPTLNRIKQQANEYYSALDSSISVAQQGFTFCTDAESLCESLLDPSLEREDLEIFITDMRKIASCAHSDATITSQKFRTVRQGLLEITRDIPTQVAQLEEKGNTISKRKSLNERRAQHFRTAAAFFSKMANVSVPDSTTRPEVHLASIVLPAVLPLLLFVTTAGEDHYKSTVKKRESEAHGYTEAIGQLAEVTTGLDTLLTHVDRFAAWWKEMDVMLDALESRVGQFRSGGTPTLTIAAAKQGWGSAKGMYLDYNTKIKRLQDFYPSPQQRKLLVNS